MVVLVLLLRRFYDNEMDEMDGCPASVNDEEDTRRSAAKTRMRIAVQ